MRSRRQAASRTSAVVTRPDEDDDEPERPRRVSFARRRTESDKFVVYVARTFRPSNAAPLRPTLPWLAIRLSSPEYDVGVRVEDAARWVVPIADVPAAAEMLRPGGRPCRTLRLVTFRDRAWVWSKVGSVAEQLRFLGLRAPDAALASTDVITEEWRSAHGDAVPVVSRLATGVLSYDTPNDVVPTPLGEVHVHREHYRAQSSNTLVWGLYRDDAPHMALVSMCKSSTREAAAAAAYKTDAHGYALMLTYSPDTDMERRFATAPAAAAVGYAPSAHALSFITHSEGVWGRALVAKFREAFVDLLRRDPRMKLSLGHIASRYLPCHPVAACADGAGQRAAYGTCRHIEFVGDTTIRTPRGVWELEHRLEADLT